MKKVLAILTLLAYFVVSSGFTVSLHYCMDQYDSLDIGNTSDEKCHKCGMHKDGGCCKDEVLMVKLVTTHMATPGLQVDYSMPVAEMSHTEFFFTPFHNFPPAIIATDHSPPLSEQFSYIDHCVFRI
jgi:hypothetical protein